MAILALVRIRGTAKANIEIIDTLEKLKLSRKNSCVLVEDTPSLKGMIMKAKDYITWGPASEDLIKKLLTAKKLQAGKDKNPYKGLVFKLSPPRKGFRGSIKQHGPKGELGKRADVAKLIERMI